MRRRLNDERFLSYRTVRLTCLSDSWMLSLFMKCSPSHTHTHTHTHIQVHRDCAACYWLWRLRITRAQRSIHIAAVCRWRSAAFLQDWCSCVCHEPDRESLFRKQGTFSRSFSSFLFVKFVWTHSHSAARNSFQTPADQERASEFGWLYGMIPVAPTVYIFAEMYEIHAGRRGFRLVSQSN